MDNYTRDFFKSVKASLSSVVGRLDRLVGIADRPRDNNDKSVNPKNTANQDDYAAIRQILLSLNTAPTSKATRKWYQTIDGWKKLLEFVAIPFAIAYAVITYNQWRDIRHNFEVDERAWVKNRPDKDIVGVFVKGAPVPWSENAPVFPLWNVTLTNIGKSVATDLSTDGMVELLENQQIPSMKFPEAHTHSTLKVLYPQEDASITLTIDQISSPRSLTKDEFEKLMSGEDYLVVFAETRYRDQFGEHWSRSCNFAGAFDASKTKSFTHHFAAKPCTDWNAVGDGQPPSSNP